jgi:glucan 1,3-beta-glucosidase
MSYPQWQTNTTNVNRTLEVISTLVAEFSQPKYQGVVTAIELLNEPGGFYDDVLAVLKPYWQSGYDVVRAQSSDLWVIIEDGFKGLAYWKGFMNTPEATGVMMDTVNADQIPFPSETVLTASQQHVYQIFSNDQLERTWDEHIQAACSYGDGLTSYTSDGGLYTIIGEWTPAPTDCAQWLNGRGRDARWSSLPGKSCDGFSGDMGTFSSDYKDFLGRSVLRFDCTACTSFIADIGTGLHKPKYTRERRDGSNGPGR